MIAGRYTLDREIGRGGAGIVHLAHDEVLGRTVAIKRIGLLPGTTDQDVERAEREARIAAGINHPHVVSILDLVKDVDCYWLVMEHVHGRTLARGRRGRRTARAPSGRPGSSPRPRTRSCRPTGPGIVHRDVKPSNIMVGDDDHAKLGDFGIARGASDSALTVTGEVTGSPAYLAPEVASGSPATRGERRLVARRHALPRGRRPSAVRRGRQRHGRALPDRPRRAAAAAGRPPPRRGAGPDDGQGPRRAVVGRAVRDELRRVAAGAPASEATQPGWRRAPAPTRPAPAADPPAAELAPAAPPAGRSDASEPEPRVPSRTARLDRGRRGPRPAGGLGRVAPVARRRRAARGRRPSTQQPRSRRRSRREEPSEEPSDRAVGDRLRGADHRPQPVPDAARVRRCRPSCRTTSPSRPPTPSRRTPCSRRSSRRRAAATRATPGFWGTIRSASPSDISVDPESLTVSYTIDYVTTSGRTTTSQGRLQLVQQGDGYLIAAEG